MWTCVGAMQQQMISIFSCRHRRHRHHTREVSEENPTFFLFLTLVRIEARGK
jgi:hypothetical protein